MGMSAIYRLKRAGARTELWGTPSVFFFKVLII